MDKKQVRWGECATLTATATHFPLLLCLFLECGCDRRHWHGASIISNEPGVLAPVSAGNSAAGDTIAFRPQGDENLPGDSRMMHLGGERVLRNPGGTGVRFNVRPDRDACFHPMREQRCVSFIQSQAPGRDARLAACGASPTNFRSCER